MEIKLVLSGLDCANCANKIEAKVNKINGIKVDINPIIVEKSGTLKEFMKRSNEYDKEHTI